jgi:DoxX-like protein
MVMTETNNHETSPAPSPTDTRAETRVRRLAYWAPTLIVVTETAVGGLWWDLGRIPYVRETFAHLGYPLYFATIMGVAKGLAAVALLIPRFPRLKGPWVSG